MQPEDELEINRLTQFGDYSEVNKKPFSDSELQAFLQKSIIKLYTGRPIVISLIGAPASGKSILVDHIIKWLNSQGHLSASICFDGFNLLTRKERNEKIKQGLKPDKVKDFELNRQIIEAVREGKQVLAPVYNELTGDAIIRPKNEWYKLEANLHFLIEDGDFQPPDNPDLKIYLHVPTLVRRQNRIERDLKTRHLGNSVPATAESIGKSFDYRVNTQYYPYTFPNAAKSDILIITIVKKAKNHTYAHHYSYKVYKRNN